MKRSWYAFSGGNPLDVTNYHRITVKPGYICGHKICAIYAQGQNIHPAEPLSPNIRQYILEGLETELCQPFDPYHSKKYVYLKDV
ncbi:hypothetical protein SAMN06265348_11795 [Pedobacter westerhofensis]|uniref:Uncharacterized protein n=1 Tax=Pedobacter westerhofensis TaxID=425512 RepID=A0A521FRC3_9SPHI|nr:hypothetical protein SAMN06265348_11795 [Pedobacter westerhofensis]